MSYEFYKITHLVSVVGLFIALGALAYAGLTSAGQSPRYRKVMVLGHGITLALILISGFGLLARLGIVAQTPVWIYGKIAVWLLLGASASLLLRKPKFTAYTVAGFLVLAAIAISLVVYRPI